MNIEAFIDQWGLALGIGVLIAAMIYIIWDLARESKAGKFGTFILFVGLGVGMLGFIIKVVIQFILETNKL